MVTCFDIGMFASWNNTVKPDSASVYGEAPPVTPHILFRCIQNYAANSGVEDLVEVGQQLRPSTNAGWPVMHANQGRIRNERCYRWTIIIS